MMVLCVTYTNRFNRLLSGSHIEGDVKVFISVVSLSIIDLRHGTVSKLFSYFIDRVFYRVFLNPFKNLFGKYFRDYVSHMVTGLLFHSPYFEGHIFINNEFWAK